MIEHITPQTPIGKELHDIITLMRKAGMAESSVLAAVLGRVGVCSACWPDRMPLIRQNDATPQYLQEPHS